MASLRDSAHEVKQAIDKIEQAKANPQQLAQAIADAKQKAAKLVQEAEKQQE